MKKYLTGYKGKKIIDPSSVNIEKILKGSDQELIVTYGELRSAWYYQSSKELGEVASNKGRELVDEVRKRLEKVGWHAHIFKTGSAECKCRRNLYLHQFVGLPRVHQVPFSRQWNVELTLDELFDDKGKLRSKSETLSLLKKRIGEKPLDLEELVANGEIKEKDRKIIEMIMDEEGIFEIHEVGEHIFRSGSKEYEWIESEEKAEERARECLEDGELWREEVRAEKTTKGLDEWIDEVLSIDGWEHILCVYDGVAHHLENGVVYWRIH